jgi:ABC-type multidrug transport system fused ATPase/permease subunit
MGYIVFIAVIIASGWINMSAFFGIGDIFKVLQLSQSFLFPMVMLSMMFPQLESALGAMDRVIDIFEAKPAVADVEDAEDLQIEDDAVNFNNVSFAYEANEYVLTDVSFSAKSGEMIAVVGHTGAGKTTLFSSLLTRFYDVSSGSISIGEQDIRLAKQSSLRQAIGLVTQEPFLFTGSVMENILYGAPDATEKDVFNISKRINADEFIEALPQGYDTQVVEGGKKLSAGQRQIITVARTMLADPRILVLDEATSRLDAYTESLVQAAQKELFKGRTTFVIAHRLSTIKDADRIVVLDHGELKELGNHNELMEKEGIYADLYNTYYVHQGLADITIKPEDLGIETLDQDIQTKKGAANKMAMGQKHGGMKGKKPSKKEMKKMKKEKDDMSPMKQPSKGLTPEMIENLKERAKNLNPEDIKTMMKKMKKLTGEDFPEELKKMLLQISEKHKNKK